MSKFVVIEFQSYDNGTMSTPAYAYDNQNAAEAKYHSILATAATSALPKHAAVILTDEGFPISHDCYIHESQPVEESNG